MDQHQRPTLGQLAAQAAEADGEAAGGDPDFWQCPRCGCRGPHNWRIAKTYNAENQHRRTRICRNCGQENLRTVELPIPKGFKAVIVRDDGEAVA